MSDDNDYSTLKDNFTGLKDDQSVSEHESVSSDNGAQENKTDSEAHETDNKIDVDEIPLNKDTISADLIRGHINTIILRTLDDRDKYGYEIIDEIQKKSYGQYELKQPTLYSALKRLENQGYITAYWKTDEISLGGRRKYYTLTELGRSFTKRNKREWEYTRSVIDQLISDEEYDFTQPAPGKVDFNVLKQATTRVPNLKNGSIGDTPANSKYDDSYVNEGYFATDDDGSEGSGDTLSDGGTSALAAGNASQNVFHDEDDDEESDISASDIPNDTSLDSIELKEAVKEAVKSVLEEALKPTDSDVVSDDEDEDDGDSRATAVAVAGDSDSYNFDMTCFDEKDYVTSDDADAGQETADDLTEADTNLTEKDASLAEDEEMRNFIKKLMMEEAGKDTAPPVTTEETEKISAKCDAASPKEYADATQTADGIYESEIEITASSAPSDVSQDVAPGFNMSDDNIREIVRDIVKEYMADGAQHTDAGSTAQDYPDYMASQPQQGYAQPPQYNYAAAQAAPQYYSQEPAQPYPPYGYPPYDPAYAAPQGYAQPQQTAYPNPQAAPQVQTPPGADKTVISDEEAKKHAETEEQRRRTHENYEKFIAEAEADAHPKEDVNPALKDVDAETIMYNGGNMTERNYTDLIDGIYNTAVKNGAAAYNVDHAYTQQQGYGGYPQQPAQDTAPQGVKVSYADPNRADSVQSSANGIRINRAENQPEAEKSYSSTYNLGMSIFRASIPSAVLIAILAIIGYVFTSQLGVNYAYGTVLIVIAAVIVIGCAVPAILKVGEKTVKSITHGYISSSIVICILGILVVCVIAILLNVDYSSAGDVMAKMVIPSIAFLALPLYAYVFYRLTK